MTEPIAIPLWQLWLLLGLSVYAIIRLLLLPVLRQMIYFRVQSAEHSLNKSLSFGIPEYAKASRQLWIDRIINDPQVRTAIIQTETSKTFSGDAKSEAKKYATEIVPTFNILLYFRVGFWLARKALRTFYWIETGLNKNKHYNHIHKDSCVVLVSNHRSNMDPLLLIYLTSKTAPVSYSAGEWAKIWPFQQILHAIGFSIIRRNDSNNPLYKKILERYVYLATQNCIPQGLFLEGALSLDGSMQDLKLGMLNYVSKAYKTGRCQDIIFVPCAVNYDRIPEDKTLIQNQLGGFKEKTPWYSLVSFVKFAATVSSYIIPRRHKPYGYACVNFGEPLSLSRWQTEQKVELQQLSSLNRRNTISELGAALACRIQQLIPIMPTSLLATVFLDNREIALSELELKTQCLLLAEKMKRKHAPIALPLHDGDYALSQGIYILLRRNTIQPTGDGRFRIVQGNINSLEYYRNAIAHHL